METGSVALSIFLILAFSILTYLVVFKQKRKSFKDNLRIKNIPIISYVFLFIITALIFIVFIKPDNTLTEPDEVLKYSRTEKLYHQTFWAYYKKIQANRYDYESIFYLNKAYNEIDENRTMRDLMKVLPDYKILTKTDFTKLSQSVNPSDRDLGFFGLAVNYCIYYKDPIRCRII